MSATKKDYYIILGVINSAELAVIKAAYKALMMIYHPDRPQTNKEEAIRKSKELNEAYATLSDPENRKKYDTERLAKGGMTSDKFNNELNILHSKIVEYQEKLKAYNNNSIALQNNLNEYEKIIAKSEIEIIKLKNKLHEFEIIIAESEIETIELKNKLNVYQRILKESEDILKILNEPD